MYNAKLPNEEAFKLLCEDIARGTHGALTLVDIHKVFGQEFFELMVITLVDSRQDIINLVMSKNSA